MHSVALSCTLNLSGPNLKAYFTHQILDLAKKDVAPPKKRSEVLIFLQPFYESLVESEMDISKLLFVVVRRKADLMETNKSNELEGKITDIVEYL